MRHRFRRSFLLAAVSVLAFSGTAGVDAEEPVPGSCKLHQVHVVNPGCVPALTEPVLVPDTRLPNLVPDVPEARVFHPWVLDPEREEFVPGPPHLGFDSWVMNLGEMSFQLTMSEADATSPEVSQCVAWTAERLCREMRPVGGFEWHQEHEHFHFADFERYEFRRLGPDGRPDYSDTGLILMMDKVGFCLIDSQEVRDDGDPLSMPYYYGCSQTQQGLSAGWADVYDYSIEGQHFPIEGLGLSDGRYALVVALNRHGSIYETDLTDNKVEVTIELSNNLTQATVIERRYP